MHTFHPFGYVALHVHEHVEVVGTTEVLFRKAFNDATKLLLQFSRTETFVRLYPLVKVIDYYHFSCNRPYQKKIREMTKRRRVVLLDLDHTLVHTTKGKRFPDYDVIPHETHHIHIRPYVREFLRHLMDSSHLFEFGFWTCGKPEYARHVVSGLLRYVNVPDWPVHILLTRDDAVIMNGTYVKDLRLVKRRFGITDLLLLDDSHVHLTIPSNVAEVCIVPAFHADDSRSFRDRFLLNLMHGIQRTRVSSPPGVHRPTPVRPTYVTSAPVLW